MVRLLEVDLFTMDCIVVLVNHDHNHLVNHALSMVLLQLKILVINHVFYFTLDLRCVFFRQELRQEVKGGERGGEGPGKDSNLRMVP